MYYIGCYQRRCNIDIEELSNKIDKYHEEDKKRAKKDRKKAKKERLENLGYIAFGFALTTTGLAVINPDCTDRLITSLAALVLLIIGVLFFRKSKKCEKRKLKIE